MAEQAGYGGKFEYDGTPASGATTAVKGINNWTVSYTGDALETTDFANAGVRTYIAGPTGWTGTISGYYDSSSAAVYNSTIAPGNTIRTEFTMMSGKSMDGTAIVTGMSFTTGIDGAVTANLELQGYGALTIT